jgi:hypothetical protein
MSSKLIDLLSQMLWEEEKAFRAGLEEPPIEATDGLPETRVGAASPK